MKSRKRKTEKLQPAMGVMQQPAKPPRSSTVVSASRGDGFGDDRGSNQVHVRMVRVNTPLMVCVDCWPSDVDVSGAFVKFAPTVSRENRDSLDLAGIADELRTRGALAVVMAPVVTSAMGRRAKPQVNRVVIDARERVKQWLRRNGALTDSDRESVMAYLDRPMSEEGL